MGFSIFASRKFRETMKTVVALLLILGLSGISLGQPILESDVFYAPGDVVTGYDFNVSGIDDGADGPNQVWDFSGVETLQLSEIWSGNVSSPSNADSYGLFSNANLALVLNNGTVKYWSNHTDKLTAIGQGGDTDILELENPMVWMHYPFTFGSTSGDEASGTLYSSCRDYGWQGSSETQGVGYGTLITPAGTFENVLKIRRITFTSKHNLEIGIDRESSIVEHFWFTPQIAGPLMYTRSWNNNGCPGSNSGAEGVYFLPESQNTNTSVNSVSEDFTVTLFPNPASSHAQLNIRASEKTTGTIWVSDMLGQPVLQVNNLTTIEKSNLIALDLNTLQPGMYMVNIKTDNRRHSEKLIIQ
jgi:hypothetical protein